MQRRLAALTIDLEDYRRQELRDCRGGEVPSHPAEVQCQLDALLELLDRCDAHATVFAVGRLASELPSRCWSAILSRHTLGCHGHEHLSVRMMGAARFRNDLLRSKAALEDVAGVEVAAFRAPYFSVDGCDPWFGGVLAECGFSIDSSRRLHSAPPRFAGLMSLPGSAGAIWEVPLFALGYGPKRIAVIGGTYLRVLPLRVVLTLFDLAGRRGFIPMVYLHPYDIDPHAEPLDLPGIGHALHRLGDQVRRSGRSGVGEKLRALSRLYEFRPVEYFVCVSRAYSWPAGCLAPQAVAGDASPRTAADAPGALSSSSHNA